MSQSMGKNGLSLRYKILLVVTGLPLIALIVFYFMVIDLFKEDKQAYIYNQVQTNARAKASSVSAEIAASLDALAAIDQTVDPNKHAMTRTGHYVFYSIKEIVGFVSISVNEKGELLRSTRPYLKPQKGIGSLNPSQMNLYLYPQKVLHRLENRNILIQAMKGNHSYIAVTHRVKTLFGNRIVSGIFNKEALSLIFKNDGPEQIMLASNIHGLLLGEPDQDLFKSVHNFAKKSSIPEITKELLVNDTKYIISIIRTTLPDIYVSSGVLLEEAYKATEFLSWKTLIFCVALLSLTVIIAILSTQPVTRSIEGLSEATNKIASGDFDFKIKIASGGEIAQLASNFNSMASKIKSLLADTQDKARMEAELRTAQAVQELLLPEPKFKTNDVEITGAAIAAEECGGDWWHHFQSEKYYFIFIGDATGHGAPAALITSAARSAVAM
ncbi:MAG: HAMP domain-containing protein, partial [Bdellovibrionales bacterium]|nr:HAMP domain-containing protein [Bdellovibrionales bacterium]